MDKNIASLEELLDACEAALELIYVISPFEGDTTRKLKKAILQSRSVLSQAQPTPSKQEKM